MIEASTSCRAATRAYRLGLCTTLLFVAISFAALVARADEWPQFRGPTGLGHSAATDLPVSWGGPQRENIVWQSPLRGEGHASPIVWKDRVFTCTVEWPASVDDRAKVIPDHLLTCFSADDGRMLWQTPVPPGPWLRGDFRSGAGGGYAGPTPATDGERVYCAFGSSVLAAVDFSGNLLWRRELSPHSFDVTIGASPVLFGKTVIMLCARAVGDSSVLALDRETGEIAWEEKLPTTGFAHSTPVIIDAGGPPQMLVLASGAAVTDDALQSLDPATGQRLWWCRGAGESASPAYGAGMAYFDSGRGGPGVAVDVGGKGDVTATHVRWTVDQVPEGIGSPIILAGHVYRLHAPNVLKCWDLKTGEQVYAKRLEGLTSTWASAVADGTGRLYFASGGTSIVVKSGAPFEVLATNELGDDNHASAAVSGSRIFIMGLKQLHCIGKGE